MHPEWIGENRDAVGILRVSSNRQKDGISHESQEMEIRSYCEENGLRLVCLERIVESAKDSESRAKYAAAMKRALTSRIRHILFYMYDREARNLTDTETNAKLVRADRICLHYVREKKVLHKRSPDSDFFMRNIHAVMNTQFIDNLRAKTNDSMRRKAEMGLYPSSHVPLGYAVRRKKDENGVELRRGTAFVVPDPDQRKVKWVQREFELRAKGYSYPQIREMIIKEGFVSEKDAKSYWHSSIENRIKNPFYDGYFVWQGMLYKGKHELIIPPRTLKLARESLGEMKAPRVDLNHGVFGGGWLRCADCDCIITYDPKKRVYPTTGREQTFHYYRCSNGKKAHASLAGRSVTEDALWAQFDQVVNQISLSHEMAAQIADVLNQRERREASESLKVIDRLKSEIASLTTKEDRAYDDMLAGLLDENAFKRHRDRIRSERVRLSEELERANAAIRGKFSESVSSIIELATSANLLYKSRSPRERRDFLDCILSNPRLRGRTIEYDLKKHWVTLLEIRGVEGVVALPLNLSNLKPPENDENE